jgi:hypothetical protein
LTILLPWGARGIISNGGFKFFFEGPHDLHGVAQGFRALGFDRAAAACEEVQSAIFPATPISTRQRQAILDEVDWERFESLEDVIFDVQWEDLVASIGKYVCAHPQAFRHRRPLP